MASLPAPKTLRHPSRLTSFPWNDNQDLKVYATIRTPLPLIVVRALPVATPPPQARIAPSLDRTASVGSSHGSNASFHSTPFETTLQNQHFMDSTDSNGLRRWLPHAASNRPALEARGAKMATGDNSKPCSVLCSGSNGRTKWVHIVVQSVMPINTPEI